jgi:hypothetical protein
MNPTLIQPRTADDFQVLNKVFHDLRTMYAIVLSVFVAADDTPRPGVDYVAELRYLRNELRTLVETYDVAEPRA